MRIGKVYKNSFISVAQSTRSQPSAGLNIFIVVGAAIIRPTQPEHEGIKFQFCAQACIDIALVNVFDGFIYKFVILS